ncbi:DNA-directed RNA polymerase subunit beta' [Candidatus Berkelbacteria bacterium]|nr:DNA-directed RNA polymerase subunit beta' [Candidatus Berkelbacteria bacterium]
MEKEKSRELEFEALRLTVASPEQISAWSFGEVLKPETINYRTQRPERDGLFDERIFGPAKDFECYCGKYKKVRFKGVICDKCGVEVTHSSVRRERMGHIELASPVAHIWYVKGMPSVLGLILGLSVPDLERVIYFSGFLIKEVNEQIQGEALKHLDSEYQKEKAALAKEKESNLVQLEAAFRQSKAQILNLTPHTVLSEAAYFDLSLRYGSIIKVGIGAEAIFEALKNLKLEELKKELEAKSETSSLAEKRKVLKRLRLVSDFLEAGLKPDWLILSRLPVIPPDLRPMVQLDGGRFATSDLNDLYRRVINRNNRLKRLLAQGAPEVICRNEKRMLQEAVDALIDNQARRGRAATSAAQRKLRSLSDMLRGKQGRFRQNLLGKRVDYSGRSVIVVGPELRMDECGLPKIMALELFRPFVISRLIKDGYVHNVRNAQRLIEQQTPEVWDILEEVTTNYYVLLNRAPTLHRLGIQAFRPVLIEGKAIRVHPLVTYAYNADFDGDQMAVHVPLSTMARFEAAEIMRSSLNLLKPSSGEPVVTMRLDLVWGAYYLTHLLEKAEKEPIHLFADPKEALLAFESGQIKLQEKIKVRKEKEILETTAGRLIFNNSLPAGFPYQNETQSSGMLKKVVALVFEKFGNSVTAQVVDKIKDLAFETATLSGMTISLDDLIIPEDKEKILAETEQEEGILRLDIRRGLITPEEGESKILELWMAARDRIKDSMTNAYTPENPVYMMITSGARGSFAQVTQLSGIKGLVVNPAGQIIPLPIKHNYKEGLSVFEYFISSHGARKGKSDTSLRTSDAGYLTRRLVDVSQDVIIQNIDCKTKNGIRVSKSEEAEFGLPFWEKISGWVALKDVVDPETRKVLVKKNELITEKIAKEAEKSNIEEVWTRSVLTCEEPYGLCAMCYGQDLSKGELVRLGEVVGTMAAQAIGEPGTQLTMKTFHMGGVTGTDITTGLPRVEELFEARPPRNPAILAEFDGRVLVTEEAERLVLTLESKIENQENYNLADYPEAKLLVKNGEEMAPRQAVLKTKEGTIVRTKLKGKAKVFKEKIEIKGEEKVKISYPLAPYTLVLVGNGEPVKKGQQLTEGALDLSVLLRLRGREAISRYIVNEISSIYVSQGQKINDKHLEVIVSQMLSKVKIKDFGDSRFLPGQIVDLRKIREYNALLKEGGKKITYDEIVMGISRVSLKTDSWLSAASFQETTSVLVDAAVRGAIDNLRGLKENVIIGRLIPAGTAFQK